MTGFPMHVRLKLSGFLKEKSPPGGTLSLADGATIEDVLTALGIAPSSVQSSLVNGRFERDRTRTLQDGDELSLLPPVGGG
jgi:molybdopterin converting factor small subunit